MENGFENSFGSLGETTNRLVSSAQTTPISLLLGQWQYLHRQNVLFIKFFKDAALAAHRVNGHNGALQGQQIQQPRNGLDLIGLVIDFAWPGDQLLLTRPRRDHVDGGLSRRRIKGAAKRLAINSDNTVERVM